MTRSGLDDSALRHVDSIYYDGAHYDRRYETYTRDIEFWCALARSTAGPVLELAAGTGRLALPIAESGREVVGLDVAPSMVAQAQRKRRPATAATFLVGDMRHFALERTFGLVILACSSVCHLLTDADAASCFAAVARHLRPAGVFAVDVATPHHETATADGQWRDRFGYPDPATGAAVTVRGRRRYTPETRMLVDDLEYTIAGGRTARATRTSRMYTADQLADLLDGAGLRVDRSYGGFDGRPPSADAQTQILICSLGRAARGS